MMQKTPMLAGGERMLTTIAGAIMARALRKTLFGPASL